MFSRRGFLFTSGAGMAIPRGAFAAADAAAVDATAIDAEIQKRAAKHAREKYLVVDYYRIRRQLAYPLPVESLSLPGVTVPSISEYPWATWMTWALEERVHSLGWAAEWSGREEYARLASRDLEALAGFPKYCQYPQPDLSSAHSGRLLWAAGKWKWVSEGLRAKIRAACVRHVEEVRPLVAKYFGPVRSAQDLLALPEPYRKLPNIPLIGTSVAAMTATAAGHEAAAELHGAVQAVFGAILELRPSGLTEGVAYDGYVLDFIADWLETAPAAMRDSVLGNPVLKQFLEESYMLGVPGAIEDVAQLSDVEPKEMPFHYSAQAKLERLRPDEIRGWYLPQWPVEWIRADALGALRPLAGRLRGKAPAAGALRAHYAVVLRSGWEKEDVAVAVSSTNSPMAHMQTDNGTVLIGTQRRWIISDPGYQQYVEGPEREFTLGPTAHNYPHPGGIAQDKKEPRLKRLEEIAKGLLRADIDLSSCYPAAANVRSVERSVWLDGRRVVVIADRVEAAGAATQKIHYHWHGHPEASWWADGGWVLLHLPECDLWLTTPNAKLTDAAIDRHLASRGQLTLGAEVDGIAPVVWWVFVLSGGRVPVEMSGEGKVLRVGGRGFEV